MSIEKASMMDRISTLVMLLDSSRCSVIPFTNSFVFFYQRCSNTRAYVRYTPKRNKLSEFNTIVVVENFAVETSTSLMLKIFIFVIRSLKYHYEQFLFTAIVSYLCAIRIRFKQM